MPAQASFEDVLGLLVTPGQAQSGLEVEEWQKLRDHLRNLPELVFCLMLGRKHLFAAFLYGAQLNTDYLS